jgi:hypothetical protein
VKYFFQAFLLIFCIRMPDVSQCVLHDSPSHPRFYNMATRKVMKLLILQFSSACSYVVSALCSTNSGAGQAFYDPYLFIPRLPALTSQLRNLNKCPMHNVSGMLVLYMMDSFHVSEYQVQYPATCNYNKRQPATQVRRGAALEL